MPTILFVQDNSADGDGIRNALSSQGWHVNMAKNAGEALRSAAEHAPNFVLVDGALADAPSLLKSFSLGNGGPGAVVISPGGSADMTDLDSVPEADEILQRPFTAKDLIELATRRLSTPRRSGSGRSTVRGEVLNAQQIFGGILDELDEEEPAAAQATVAPKSKQPVDSAIPTQEPTVRAPVSAQPPEPADTVAPEIVAAPEVKSPGAKDDSPPPLGDLEDRLNRAMTQALQVAEEVSSASVSMSQVETFKNLDQEIEDQLAGVLSEVEHPETAKSTPATTPAAQSTPAIESPKPTAAETGRAAEQTAAPSSPVVDEETDDASRKGAESSAKTRLYESESQVEAGADSRESSEESEEYEPVDLASLPQKKRTVAIAASAAMVIAIGLFFWFRGGQQ
ncbi:MAG: hypothetical protein V3S30_12010, partial [Thermoanaerobaculia bacterium]